MVFKIQYCENYDFLYFIRSYIKIWYNILCNMITNICTLCLLIFITHDIILPFRKHHNVIIIYYNGIILDHSVKWHSSVQSYKSLGVLYSNSITHILSHPWKYITSKISKINLSEVWTLKEQMLLWDFIIVWTILRTNSYWIIK